ncbi:MULTISPECIES: hypothetical protein [unclassified Coleofasciculus]|uniref:hypothetical protein n=1 Tax=Cyanophyceae TaxID=3028117 RepID=UPI0016850106|nr:MULTISPECIES: hypothetical protein [unclassified Coleofasciculus]MBD2086120.1 hypothetical protein [Coleofasciculus sp. FACHB-542]MBD2539113.1 hypothetical protein [Coleofasciculus sp. FACHB-SPT36]
MAVGKCTCNQTQSRRLGDLALFTWLETAARPYTVKELVAIAKEPLDRTDVGRVEASISNPTLKGNEQ